MFAEAALLIPQLFALLTVLLTFMVSVGTAVLAFRTNKVVNEVKLQVTTSNGSSVAELADARETRRVSSIPPLERTVAEYVHLAVVPPVSDPHSDGDVEI